MLGGGNLRWFPNDKGDHVIDPHLHLVLMELDRELRDLSLARPRLDRPEVGRPGRLRRALRSRVSPPARVAPATSSTVPEVTIRPAVPADSRHLVRLAEISERRVPSGLVLVAEVDAGIVAALPVDGGPPLTDLRRPTRDVVQLLELRSEQVRASDLTRAA